MIQEQVISSILFSKDPSLIVLNNLDDSYFSDYKKEFNYIKNHLDEYGCVPDKESFLSKFKNFDLIEVNEPNSYLIEELIRDKNERHLASTFNKVRDLVMSGETDEAMSIYKKASEELDTSISLQCVDILKDTSRYEDYVERTQDFNKYYISTGFKELDEIIGGWDREEELATIIARTNQGKSWIAIKMALAAVEQGLNVGFYSGEMTERKVGYRIDTFASHISNGALIHGNAAIMNEYKKYIDELPSKYTGSLKVLTPQMINGPAGVSALRSFIDKYKLDILFIDQHSLLQDDRKARNPVEKAANISMDLKNLQVLKRIPIISVSQMNRTKMEDTDLIDTTQVAQSDRIAQDSTVIIGLSRDKKDSNLMKLQLVKSRDSENGKILTYNVDFNRGQFIFIPEEGDSSSQSDYENRYNVDNSGEDVF